MKKLLARSALVLTALLFFSPSVFALDREQPVVNISSRGVVRINDQVLGIFLIREGSENDQDDKSSNVVGTTSSQSGGSGSTSSKIEDEKAEVEDEVEEVELDKEDGQALVKTKSATGSAQRKVEPDKLLVKVEAGDIKNDIKIRLKGNEFELEQNGIKVLTDFSIKVDITTNNITVITPKGDVVLKTLPNQAVSKLLESNIIDRQDEATLIENPETGSSNNVVYRVKGEKDTKLFGLIAMKFAVTSDVGATTGAVTAKDLPFLLRFLGFLFSR